GDRLQRRINVVHQARLYKPIRHAAEEENGDRQQTGVPEGQAGPNRPWTHGSLHFEHVTYPAYRVQQLQLPAGVDFFPQVVDVDVNDVGRGIEIIIPHVLSEPGSGEHTARVAHKIVEEGELSGRQLDGCTTTGHRTSSRVQSEIGDLQHGRLDRGTPSEQSADTRDQFLERERLGKVIVGAGIEAQHLVFDGRA